MEGPKFSRITFQLTQFVGCYQKIKNLAVPYLIANIIVLGLVLMAYYFFGYNSLNRLSFDINLVKEGIFSFNSPPINPPTYFIRDIFIIFCIITLVTHKEIKALFIIVPYLLFGTLILRADVAFLFIVGILYSRFHLNFNKTTLILASIILTIFIGVCFNSYLKFPLSFLFFILLLNIRFPLINTGRFSYLLHLYHSPIIVITYPVISLYIEKPILKISTQIILALFFTYLLFLITKKYSVLKVLSGGR